MPELPDLEVFKGNIFARLSSKRLSGISVYNAFKVNTAAEVLSDRLKGETLQSIGRVGKELFEGSQ